jgi:hypothetical protein
VGGRVAGARLGQASPWRQGSARQGLQREQPAPAAPSCCCCCCCLRLLLLLLPLPLPLLQPPTSRGRILMMVRVVMSSVTLVLGVSLLLSTLFLHATT